VQIDKIIFFVKTYNGLTLNNEHQHTTRNIRKPGNEGKFKFYTFTKSCNGLISWSFEIPASAYYHRWGVTLKKINMKIISYLVIVVLIIILNSCKKDSQDDFDKFNHYANYVNDSLNYTLDQNYGKTYSSSFFSNNDSIKFCIGFSLTGIQGFFPDEVLGFYLLTKIAVKDMEIAPNPELDINCPSIQDLLKIFQPGQKLYFSQVKDFPFMSFSSNKEIIFTVGPSHSTLLYRTSLYENLPNNNKSYCKIIKCEKYNSNFIKVELAFDIYLKRESIDNIWHLQNGKMISLISIY
jgi:hypothetical protein